MRALEVLDTAPEERFDRLTRIVQRVLEVPIVLVSLVDEQRQWFKSRIGLGATETPRDVSFCGHAILGPEVFCVPDATADQRFADNPLVTADPSIRFYAGAPLELPGGERVGTLCAIDRQPRTLSEEQLSLLRDLASCVTEQLQIKPVLATARRLADQEERLRATHDAVIDGIVTIDARGTIETINPAVGRIFGYRATELVGQNVRRLMPEPYRSAHDDYLRAYLETGQAKVIGIGREVFGQRKDGSVFPMRLAISEMRIKDQTMFTGIVRDISARRQAEDQLRELSALQQAILDSANVSIISTDTGGRIRTFNRTARRLLGYGESEVIGQVSLASIHDAEEIASRAAQLSRELGHAVQPGFEALVARARLGTIDEHEWTYLRKDGSRFPVLLSMSVLQDDTGEVTGFLGVAVDLTERKKIERMKSEFVSTVSHELRTPLTSIRGALGLVLGKSAEGLPERVRRLLETANRNSERLGALINDILDLEKVESGRLDFEFRRLDLTALAHQAIAANEGYGQKHEVRLRLAQAPAHAEIRGDEHRLLQVFANLLSNAIKYSPPGGEVEVTIHSTDGRYRVGVRDRGRGIPGEFRSRIFQRFAQADGSDARERGGTGLGLSISKAIVERHGGVIDYLTELGVGSEFFFELPRHAAVPRPGDSAERARVLICDDNADVALVLSEMLRQDGVSSDHVGTARGALELLHLGGYDGLLLDLGLPDMDGLSLLRQLRQDTATRDLPVIVVSGRARAAEAAWRGDSLAILDWLQKPVDGDRLRGALANLPRRTARPRLLHVEDDADVIQVTRALVEEFAEYAYASTLVEARQALARDTFDLVLLDLSLPDGSGLELLAEIDSGTQVLVFSAHEPAHEVSRRVAAALTKGRVSNAQLLATIRQFVQKAVR